MMNLIKSLFITFSPLILITSAFNGIVLSLNAYPLLGLGMALSAFPLLFFLSYILLFKSIARTNKHLWPIQTTAFIGLLISLLNHQSQFLIFTALPLLSYLITLLYIYWYSNNQRSASHILANGQPLPKFQAIDTEGNQVTTADLIKHPALLMFTRGNWCPLCMAQINEIASTYQQIAELGVRVFIIASQPEKHTQSLAKRFDVPLEFLIDKDQQMGKQFGIVHHHGLPFGFQAFGYEDDQYYPTIIATEKGGKIIYSDQTSNYRVRPEPESLMALFQQ